MHTSAAYAAKKIKKVLSFLYVKIIFDAVMKTVSTIRILVLATVMSVGIMDAGVIKDNKPYPYHNAGSIIVSWTTLDETNVLRFEVWRARLTNREIGEFTQIGKIEKSELRGAGSTYEISDQEAFKGADNVFYYKIRTVYQDFRFEDSALATTFGVSSAAKRTWGSIKAMFR